MQIQFVMIVDPKYVKKTSTIETMVKCKAQLLHARIFFQFFFQKQKTTMPHLV